MKKRNSQRKQQNARHVRSNAMSDHVVKVPFRFTHLFTYAAATTVNVIDIDPDCDGLCVRLADIAGNWQFYRYNKLKLTVYPYVDTSTPSNLFGFVFVNETEGAASMSSFAEIEELSSGMMKSALEQVKTSYILPQNLLRSNTQRWYTTSANTTSAETTQFQLNIAPRAISTCTVTFMIQGEIWYKGMTVNYVSRDNKLQVVVDKRRSFRAKALNST
jgi:hypothetical protein